jgi:hypothetical protein
VHELAAGAAFPCSRRPLILFNLDDTARTSDHSPVAQMDIKLTSPAHGLGAEASPIRDYSRNLPK